VFFELSSLTMIGQDAMVLQHRQLVNDLYQLIQTLDPATFKAELSSAAEEMMETIKERVNELLENHPVPDGIKDQLQILKETFEQRKETFEQRKSQLQLDAKEEWRKLFKRLQPAYEGMAKSLRDRNLSVPILRQTNHTRSMFHAINGLLALAMVQHGFGYWGNIIIASILLTAAVVCETGRRISPAWNKKLMEMFASVAHPHETHKVNSATWYLLALAILASFVPPMGQAIAVVVLGISDPAAGIIGRRYGRLKLVGNKSLIGSTAFALTAFVAAMGIMAIYYPQFAFSHMLIVALVCALVGAIAELFTMGLDDNFTIPVTVGFATAVTLAFL
jgi:dolichol kinase